MSRDAFVLIQKPSLLPARRLCLFQRPHNVGREGLCSAPLCTGIKRDGSTERFVMKQEPLVRARGGGGGGSAIIGDRPNGKDGSQAAVLSAAETFHSRRRGEKPAEMIKPVIRIKSRLRCSPRAAMAQQAHLWLCEPAPTVHHLESAKSQGCHLSVAVDTDHQISCFYPLTHSCCQQEYTECPLQAEPLLDRGFVGDDVLVHGRAPNIFPFIF